MNEKMENMAVKLQALWSVENLLLDALPKMSAKATDFGLIKALNYHFAETQQHRTAIEAICKQLELDPHGAADAPMADMLLEKQAHGTARRAGDELIIEVAQRVEHYEMLAYKAAAEEANRLGLRILRKRLLLTLEEENQASNKLAFLLKALQVNSPEEVVFDTTDRA